MHQGVEAAKAAFETIFHAFGDPQHHLEALIIIDNDHVAEVLTIAGTNPGGLMGLPPSGRDFRVPAVLPYDVRGGKISASGASTISPGCSSKSASSRPGRPERQSP